PTYAWALGSRGETHRQAGRYDQAIADLTAALALDPTYAWALGSRGETHRQAGRYDQAIADLTAALELNPTYAWALGSRGEAHQQAGRYDQAIADLTAALELNPTYAWALGIRGMAHRQAGHYEKARVDLERAVEMDPEDLSCRFEKLMFDTLEGGLEACAEQWSDLLSSPPIPPTEAVTHFMGLLRALLVEPENHVTEATQKLLAAQPGPGDLAEVLSYMTELSAVGGGVADRARQCHDLIVEHTTR
ncbi:tetratricopeptide repeat protein, partial [Streptomyces sp. NPDC006622]|uniref:tetratricopeptide repeat protein n=1 Tax=Streptomyces sp. NPDC006622 TaxID=3155459 RepID=UPI0033A797F7